MQIKEPNMHLIGQRILGIIILILLGLLVAVKWKATGSILEKPKGNLLLLVVNAFNLFFLLIVNPLAAILLVTGRLETVDLTHLEIGAGWFLMLLELGGFIIYLSGFFLMARALSTLKANYQLGGSTPRAGDTLILSGPYRIVRHPMYTAVLGIALGLACLTQSLAFYSVFVIYLVLIIFLIPAEEDGLRQMYGEQYAAYQKKVKRLFPLIY
jgi:protein-S-isoprenylcysteine O-methyltransferase Ste14